MVVIYFIINDGTIWAFLLFLIDFIAFNVRLSKSLLTIASSIVSVVMSFIFETNVIL